MSLFSRGRRGPLGPYPSAGQGGWWGSCQLDFLEFPRFDGQLAEARPAHKVCRAIRPPCSDLLARRRRITTHCAGRQEKDGDTIEPAAQRRKRCPIVESWDDVAGCGIPIDSVLATGMLTRQLPHRRQSHEGCASMPTHTSPPHQRPARPARELLLDLARALARQAAREDHAAEQAKRQATPPLDK